MRALLGARASEKFLEGFAKSASMIILSEIGDKTFFIAALLAVRHARAVVFLGSWSALTVMTALSAVVGAAAPTLINAETTHRAATTLFFVFGVRSLRDAMTSSGDDGDVLGIRDCSWRPRFVDILLPNLRVLSLSLGYCIICRRTY